MVSLAIWLGCEQVPVFPTWSLDCDPSGPGGICAGDRKETHTMNAAFSRRKLIQAAGVAALPFPATAAATMSRRPNESADNPRSASKSVQALATGALNQAGAHRVKQLGVDHVIAQYPVPIPWQGAPLRELIGRLKRHGLTLGNLMIVGFPNTMYGQPGRDEEIDKVIQSIRVAGKVGLAVIEYNFYRHRLTEGYFEETGRAGAGMTAFDYDKVKDLPPLSAKAPFTRRDVGQRHVLSQGGGFRGRAAGSSPGSASE